MRVWGQKVQSYKYRHEKDLYEVKQTLDNVLVFLLLIFCCSEKVKFQAFVKILKS